MHTSHFDFLCIFPIFFPPIIRQVLWRGEHLPQVLTCRRLPRFLPYIAPHLYFTVSSLFTIGPYCGGEP